MSITKKIISGLIALTVILILPAGSVRPQNPPPPKYQTLEHYLPEETYGLLTFPDLKQTAAAFKKSALYNIWQEQEVQQLWQSLKPKVDSWIENIEEKCGMPLDDVLASLNGEFSLAVFKDDEQMEPQLVIVLDIGDHRQTVEALLKNLFEEDATSYQYKNTTIYCYNRDFYHTYLDTKLLFGPEKETIQLMINNYRNPLRQSLAASAVFQKAKTSVSATPQGGMLFVNLEQIFTVLEEEGIPPEADTFLEGCGFKSIKTIAGSFNIQDNGLSKTKIYLDMPAGERKRLAALFDETKPCQLWLDRVPAGVLSYNAISIDFSQAWTEFEDIIQSIGLPMGIDLDEEFSQKLGFSLKDDLLPSLGTNFVSYSTLPEPGSLQPIEVTIAKLKDKEKFESCMTKLAEKTNTHLQKISFKNYEIKGGFNYKNLMMIGEDENLPDELASMPFLQSLWNTTYYYLIIPAGQNTYIYGANNLDALKKVIEQMGQNNPAQAGLADDPAFKKAPDSFYTNPQYVLYVNEKQMYSLTVNYIRQIFNTILPLMMGFNPDRGGEGQEVFNTVNTVLNQLPSGQTIGKHLGGTYATVKATGEGVKIESVSSVGLEISVPVVAVIAAVAIPNLVTSKLTANEVSAQSGLRTLIGNEAVWMQQDPDRNGIKDYWTYDVSIFYRMYRADGQTLVSFIDQAFARADAAPAKDNVFGETYTEDWTGVVTTAPKTGYFFKAMKLNSQGNPYNQETVGDTGVAATNPTEFAFAAYPAEYGKTGKRTFIVNQAGTVYAKDLGPNLGMVAPKQAPPLTPELEKEIQKLIKNMGDPSFEIRDQATQRLIEINQTALKYLKEALVNNDAEVRFRANLIIKKITEPPLLPIDKWPAGDPATEGWEVAD